jgi:hypothetical protein
MSQCACLAAIGFVLQTHWLLVSLLSLRLSPLGFASSVSRAAVVAASHAVALARQWNAWQAIKKRWACTSAQMKEEGRPVGWSAD